MGKVLNAFEAKDEDEMREMAIWFTLAAAHALACVRRHVFSTDRRIFVELRGFKPLGTLIWRLRFSDMSLGRRVALAVRTWNRLLREVRSIGVDLEALRLTEV